MRSARSTRRCFSSAAPRSSGAVVVALLASRGLARPIVEMSRQAREVLHGEPKPVRGRRRARARGVRGGLQPRHLRPHAAQKAPCGGRAHRGTPRNRAPRRARNQKSARSDPRRGRDAAPAARTSRPGLRRVLRRGDAHGARRGRAHQPHRERVHAFRAPAAAEPGADGPRRDGAFGRGAPRDGQREARARRGPRAPHRRRSRPDGAGPDEPRAERARRRARRAVALRDRGGEASRTSALGSSCATTAPGSARKSASTSSSLI